MFRCNRAWRQRVDERARALQNPMRLPCGRQESTMRHVRHFLQHRFNPLHVYCRLREAGLSKRAAGRVSTLYERYVYRVCGLH
ncbi:MAG TPA: hypothetical protein DEF41_13805 [Desulfovibrio sp.]|uniref:Uncharacterized protein n=2 Tax=Nitratidesulfovibrio vulgaris TaxID=881 RepID=Q72EW4_NITV2|nr:hypothetical protein DVU_0454 [Nitratidesulfovibrio vulgaris str. Hildenborough]ABM29498.1 conserved hypothetical protein [Nitratidesulfovibrio vulgaris DP4]HBW17161.1 hypothetical protein [Desulfovibrio sp.]